MNPIHCADIDRLLSEGVPIGQLTANPALRSHAGVCPRCAALVCWASLPAQCPPPPLRIEERIRSMIQADLRPVRPVPAHRVGVAYAFALALFVSAMHGLTMGASGYAALSFAQTVSLGLFLATVILLSAVSLVSSIRPGSRRLVPPLLPVLTLTVGFPLLLYGLFDSVPGGELTAQGISCFAGGLMVSAIASGVTYVFARRGYSISGSRTGSLAGILGGATALLALQISCPDLDFQHIAVWHSLAMLFSVAGGYLAGKGTQTA